MTGVDVIVVQDIKELLFVQELLVYSTSASVRKLSFVLSGST